MKLIYVAHKFGGNLTLADNAERLTTVDRLDLVQAWVDCIEENNA